MKEKKWVTDFDEQFTFTEKEGEQFFKMSVSPLDIKLFISKLVLDAKAETIDHIHEGMFGGKK